MTDDSPSDESRELEIFFTKSPAYRVVHADGAWGGLTGALGMHLGFYSEFREPPDSITYGAQGTKLEERGRSGREAVVRQIEVEVIFNLQTAQALRGWLDEKLRDAAKAAKELGEMSNREIEAK